MTTIENSGLRDKLGSAYHRITEKKNTFFDSDCCGTNGGDITLLQGVDMNTYDTQYYIDFKRQENAADINKQSVSNKYFAIKAQIAKANKDKVPFFMVLTYLGWQYKDQPMYYAIPMNKVARLFTTNRHLSLDGFWLTLKTYSQFIAQLKGNKWNENEEIDFKNRWNENCHISDKRHFYQKDLPNKATTYDLPNMEWINFDETELKQMGELI